MLKQIDDKTKFREAITTERIGKTEVNKKDCTVQMLHSCVKARKTQSEQEKKLVDLVERVNMDRPILQAEKIKLILFEQGGKEMTTNQIKKQLVEVRKNRKAEFIINKQGFVQMQEYLKSRKDYAGNFLKPTSEEI